jgi:hypothetical protein
MDDPEPFCFLDLPAELRLMVYDCLPRSRLPREIVFKVPKFEEARCNFVKRGIPVALLATCKLVYSEAMPGIQGVMTEFVDSKTPTIIINPLHGESRKERNLDLDDVIMGGILDCLEFVKSRGLDVLTEVIVHDE